ncbi:hypothetical protein AVEN_14123-1, partial [Araneus ventricosus]
SADISSNVALIVRCPDDRKSLLGPVASSEEMSEPGHQWKIVFHPNVLLQLKNVVGKERESLRSVTTHARWQNSVLERSSVLLYIKLLSPLYIIFG